MVKKAPAFTMIELIFAIVLIAIVVVAVPQMMGRNAKTLQQNLVQEELFHAARAASELLTQPWDTNAPDASTSRALSKVLDVGSTTHTNLNRITISGVTLPYRIGHIRQPLHRKFHGNVTPPADYKLPQGTQMPYLPNHTLTIRSGYCADGATGFFAESPTQSNTTPTAAKMAAVTVTNNADANRTVTLRIYAANIGEPDYYWKDI